jgi:hypothetical protein
MAESETRRLGVVGAVADVSDGMPLTAECPACCDWARVAAAASATRATHVVNAKRVRGEG